MNKTRLPISAYAIGNRMESRFAFACIRKRVRRTGLVQIRSQRLAPETITFDGCAASQRAVREMTTDGLRPESPPLRSLKYLSTLVKEDYRDIKSPVKVMLGFKRFRNAAVTNSGIELLRRIRKGQFNFTNTHRQDTTASSVWHVLRSSH
jgi:transposase-like protein